MKITRPTFSRIVIGSSAVLAALTFYGCDEKKAAPATTSKEQPGGSGGDEGADDDGGEGGGTSEFDLCKDGLKASSKLSTWKALVKELCDDDKLTELRKSSNVYTGGTPKIIDDTSVEAKETEMNLYSSAQYSAKVDDYWAMVKLQFINPSVFKENFEADPDVSMSDVDASSTSSSYQYKNDGREGGVVEYKAKTTFVTLKKGQAYVAATELGESIETMKALKGLIIVNKKSESKVEAITISYQTYEHDDGQGNATKKRAITSLENEQKRAFKNAKESDQAPDLLD